MIFWGQYATYWATVLWNWPLCTSIRTSHSDLNYIAAQSCSVDYQITLLHLWNTVFWTLKILTAINIFEYQALNKTSTD